MLFLLLPNDFSNSNDDDLKGEGWGGHKFAGTVFEPTRGNSASGITTSLAL